MAWAALAFAAAMAASAAPTTAVSTPPPAAAAALPDPFEDADLPMPDPDLWHRIRKGFLLEPLESPMVLEHEAWYSSRPDYIKRFVDRGSRYLHHIVEEVEKRGMPTEIALLPVIESAFNPHAYSRAKASGLWQFIPSTGKNYGLQQDWWQDNRRDIVAATHAALNYLQRLYDMFGSWELALAAYNCGEGCVGRAIAANQKRGLPTDFLNLRLPPETMNYVPKLVAVKNIVLGPALYGIELESIPDQPYFTTVAAPEKIDVKLAARLAGMPEDEFVALNPSHNKPVAVAHTGTLVLPLDKADTFRANLESWDKPLVSWTTVPGKKGEAVDGIAKRYGLSAATLRQVNNLQVNKKGRLTAAQPILVPGRGAPVVTQVAATKAPPPPVLPSPAPAKPAAPSATAAAPARSGSNFYTVRTGDTIYGIARQFGKAVPDLMRLNNLTARTVIQPGNRLRVQ
ncbi:MAG: transglycosylase SLT domain-containing protein [Betaproteobacteria bacterium]|nr:transglycosylase SLT domain-containing protein [Betaproteobacteria bacterium]